jgi:hypothetical protein
VIILRQENRVETTFNGKKSQVLFIGLQKTRDQFTGREDQAV